ncbi:MAG: uroporphyrinogen-III synthase [Pseudomonadota bacterium]
MLVTRPATEAARWVSDFRAHGVDAIALPLIAIEPVEDEALLAAARAAVSGYSALMFVSAAAVSHFFGGAEVVQSGPRFWATGPGTTRALEQAGVPLSSIDSPPSDAGGFDSEALWMRVASQVRTGTRVLIVRGGEAAGRPAGRDWLAREIIAAGGLCDAVVAYRRLPPVFGDAQRRIASDAATGAAIWLFSSSEAIANLCRAMPGTDWRCACAIATHARIGEAARSAGFGRVRVSAPTMAALVASIESSE